MATPVSTYELTYIINAVLSEEQTKSAVARITRNIEEQGGEILEVDEWGTRRLAYPIRKKRNGYYVNLYFRAAGEIIPRLERSLEIDADVLRYLTLKLDAKMLRHHELQKQAGPRTHAGEVPAGTDEDDED